MERCHIATKGKTERVSPEERQSDHLASLHTLLYHYTNLHPILTCSNVRDVCCGSTEGILGSLGVGAISGGIDATV